MHYICTYICTWLHVPESKIVKDIIRYSHEYMYRTAKVNIHTYIHIWYMHAQVHVAEIKATLTPYT